MKNILALGLFGVGGVAIWSAANSANGFLEVGKMLRGEPSFIKPEKPIPDNVAGKGGEFTGSGKIEDSAFDPLTGGGAW